MSIADQIERLAPPNSPAMLAWDAEGANQLKDLEEVEAVLKELGVSLEPVFDISLTARIGAVAPLEKPVQLEEIQVRLLRLDLRNTVLDTNTAA